MNKKELSYFIHHLFINHVNEEEAIAVKLNTEILLAFFSLDIISEELYSKCLESIRTNNFSDVVTVQEVLSKEFKIEVKN